MRPLIAVIFMIALLIAAGQHFATRGAGWRNTMNRPGGTAHKDIPGIDAKTPSTVKTATFALG